MTFQGIYQEIIDLRFNSQATKLAEVKRWVNAAEVACWNAADFAFKRQPVANLTVTAGAATEPADFGKALRLYDPQGSELEYMVPDEFERLYSVGTQAVTTGAAFTVINRQILVGPPDTGTYKLSYKRRYAHFASGSIVTAGVMSLDTDFPIWDSEHHYVLVPWAMILGQKLENDPTASDLKDERDSLLAAMVEELVGGVEGEVLQWGGSC